MNTTNIIEIRNLAKVCKRYVKKDGTGGSIAPTVLLKDLRIL